MQKEDWIAIWYKCLACHRFFEHSEKLIIHRDATVCGSKYPKILEDLEQKSNKNILRLPKNVGSSEDVIDLTLDSDGENNLALEDFELNSQTFENLMDCSNSDIIQTSLLSGEKSLRTSENGEKAFVEKIPITEDQIETMSSGSESCLTANDKISKNDFLNNWLNASSNSSSLSPVKEILNQFSNIETLITTNDPSLSDARNPEIFQTSSPQGCQNLETFQNSVSPPKNLTEPKPIEIESNLNEEQIDKNLNYESETTLEKLFKCAQCEKTFKKNAHLCNHMRVHKNYSSLSPVKQILNPFSSHEKLIIITDPSLSDTQNPETCQNLETLQNSSTKKYPNLVSPPGNSTTFKPIKTENNLNEMRNVEVTNCEAGKIPENLFKCIQCEKTFKRNAHLCNHMRVHKKPQYPILEKHFRTRSALNTSKRFKCTNCDIMFEKESSLLGHMWAHKKYEKFQCPTCEKHFKNVAALKSHIRSHETNFFKCTNCDKTFEKSSALFGHMQVHKKHKKFGCPNCGKHFQTLSTLKSHIRLHEISNRFKCEKCKKTFWHPSSLKSHMLLHKMLAVKNISAYCNSFKKLKRSNKPFKKLVIHPKRYRYTKLNKTLQKTSGPKTSITTQSKGFKCLECGKFFRKFYFLLYHQKIHIFECKVCDEIFHASINLKVHRLLHGSFG